MRAPSSFMPGSQLSSQPARALDIARKRYSSACCSCCKILFVAREGWFIHPQQIVNMYVHVYDVRNFASSHKSKPRMCIFWGNWERGKAAEEKLPVCMCAAGKDMDVVCGGWEQQSYEGTRLFCPCCNVKAYKFLCDLLPSLALWKMEKKKHAWLCLLCLSHWASQQHLCAMVYFCERMEKVFRWWNGDENKSILGWCPRHVFVSS